MCVCVCVYVCVCVCVCDTAVFPVVTDISHLDDVLGITDPLEDTWSIARPVVWHC